MVTLVVCVLLIIEVLLATGRLTGKLQCAWHVPLVRLSTLGVFASLVLTGVIIWSPRWYLLVAWLVSITATSVLGATRNVGEPRKVRVIVLSTAVITATIVAASPALIFPDYEPLRPTGQFHVGNQSYTITDPARPDPFSGDGRPRSLTYEIWYPEVGTGARPLVVFSHGSMGIRTSNQSMFEELASHGYVVVSIDHTGHALFTRPVDGRPVLVNRNYLADLRAENASKNPTQSLAYYRKWMAVRTGDIDFILDQVITEATTSGDVPFKLIDPQRIGLVGHSLGGAAVIGVGRLRHDIDAVVVLEAPYMTEIERVEDNRFVWRSDPYPVPVLNVYSDSAWDHLGEWPQYAMNVAMLTDPNATNIHLEGVGHLHLTDLSLSSPLLTRILNGHGSTADPRLTLRELNADVMQFLNVHVAHTARR